MRIHFIVILVLVQVSIIAVDTYTWMMVLDHVYVYF